MTEPPPPENVRIEVPDGAPIPLRLVKAEDRDGMPTWLAYGPPGQIVPRGSRLCGRMPGRGQIDLQIEQGPTGHYFFLAQPLPQQRGAN